MGEMGRGLGHIAGRCRRPLGGGGQFVRRDSVRAHRPTSEQRARQTHHGDGGNDRQPPWKLSYATGVHNAQTLSAVRLASYRRTFENH